MHNISKIVTEHNLQNTSCLNLIDQSTIDEDNLYTRQFTMINKKLLERKLCYRRDDRAMRPM